MSSPTVLDDDRLRHDLARYAATTQVSPDAWARITERAYRPRWGTRVATAAAVTLALLLAGGWLVSVGGGGGGQVNEQVPAGGGIERRMMKPPIPAPPPEAPAPPPILPGKGDVDVEVNRQSVTPKVVLDEGASAGEAWHLVASLSGRLQCVALEAGEARQGDGMPMIESFCTEDRNGGLSPSRHHVETPAGTRFAIGFAADAASMEALVDDEPWRQADLLLTPFGFTAWIIEFPAGVDPADVVILARDDEGNQIASL